MARWAMASLGVALLAATVGCTEEVIAVHGDSLANQFAQLNKNGWSANVNDASAPNTHKSILDDPNVRVIKPADFSGVKFNTNFQVDDPKLRAQMGQNQDQSQGQMPQNSGPSGMLPFGPAPASSH